MEALFEFLHKYPYVAYMLGVNLLTAGVRYPFFGGINLGPKWLTLIVGIAMGIVMFFMDWINLETPYEFFMLFSALGASSAFYDYIIKLIMDVAKRKNPFIEEKKQD